MTHMPGKNAENTLLLVDGSSYLYRAFHALPEVPPPPPGVSDPGADDPRVMIKPQEGDRVEEYRDGGRVVMLKVTPRNGPPYYLVDTTGSGNWMRRESLDDGVRVPMWTIKTFD